MFYQETNSGRELDRDASDIYIAVIRSMLTVGLQCPVHKLIIKLRLHTCTHTNICVCIIHVLVRYFFTSLYSPLKIILKQVFASGSVNDSEYLLPWLSFKLRTPVRIFPRRNQGLYKTTRPSKPDMCPKKNTATFKCSSDHGIASISGY